MTSETEGSDVFNSAFTATFNDRHNMVGRPGANKRLEPWELPPKHIERPVALRLAVHFPGELRRLKPGRSQQCLKDPRDLLPIGSTTRADPEIALKDLFPKVARIAAKFVFMDAGVRTKGPPTFRDLDAAPTAERAAVRPLWELFMIFPA